MVMHLHSKQRDIPHYALLTITKWEFKQCQTKRDVVSKEQDDGRTATNRMYYRVSK